MNIRKALASTFLLATLLAASVAPAMADPTPIPNHPRVNEVNARFENQHDRVQQGINNGSIGPWEQRRLQTEGRAFKAEEHAMRRADNGHLTRLDDRILNRQLNHRSNQIYRYKHN